MSLREDADGALQVARPPRGLRAARRVYHVKVRVSPGRPLKTYMTTSDAGRARDALRMLAREYGPRAAWVVDNGGRVWTPATASYLPPPGGPASGEDEGD